MEHIRIAHGMAIHRPDLNKTEFAELLQLAQATYATYETGVSYPNVKTLEKIRKLTGFSLDWLVCGIDPSKEKGAIPNIPSDEPRHRLKVARG